MKILCLTKYTRQGPSSRYRVYQFLPYLERAGIDVDVQTLHDENYLENLFSGRDPSPGYLIRRWMKRTVALLGARRYDLVFIQKELFPRLPDFFEAILRWQDIRLVLDIDDAIFVLYEGARSPLTRLLLENKLPRVIGRSRLVLTGNEFLTAYARQYSDRVVHFPTVVDTDRLRPGDRRTKDGVPVVGWIGSPETVRYVEDLREPLEKLAKKTNYELRLVGADRVDLEGVRVTTRPWSEEGEIEELQRFDVGIMPLSSSRWSQGKCGLKLLQYMSVGVPSVSSPVGSALEIVNDGDNGYLAGGAEEWVGKLAELIENAELRRTMGQRGRDSVIETYSLRRAGPRLAELLLETAARPL